MNIKFKMIVTLVLVSLMLIAMAGFMGSEFERYNNLKTSGGLVKQLVADLLQMRRNEKDFLARKQLSLVESFNGNHAVLDQDFVSLSTLLDQLELDTAEVAGLREVAKEYVKTFNDAARLQETIGLNPKSGLYGNLRDSVHKAEAIFDQESNDRLLVDMLMLRRHEKDFMLRRDMKYVDKFQKRITELLNDLNDSGLSASTKANASGNMDKYRADFQALTKAEQEIGLTPQDGLMGKMRGLTHTLEADLDSLVAKLMDNVTAAEKRLTVTLYTSIVVFIVLVSAILLLLTLNITRRIQAAAYNMQQIAMVDGDLTRRMDETGKDEITQLAKSFNIFTQKIHDTLKSTATLVTQLRQTGSQVTEAANETDGSMQDLRENTQSVVVAIEELSSTAHDVASNASNVSSSSQQANSQSAEGKTVVQEAIKAINSFASEFAEAADSIKSLRGESENIGSILDVIRGIAEQTNLLALNAAIEAARAGEQGRGFAVVADEVRTLAYRSHESTDQIQELISRLQERAERAVIMIEKGQGSVVSTVSKAEQAGTALTMITEAVQTISDMTTQIATAAEEQSAVVLDISKNMTRIDNLSARTAKIADGTSGLSTQLSDTILEVNREIQRFRLAE